MQRVFHGVFFGTVLPSAGRLSGARAATACHGTHHTQSGQQHGVGLGFGDSGDAHVVYKHVVNPTAVVGPVLHLCQGGVGCACEAGRR